MLTKITKKSFREIHASGALRGLASFHGAQSDANNIADSIPSSLDGEAIRKEEGFHTSNVDLESDKDVTRTVYTMVHDGVTLYFVETLVHGTTDYPAKYNTIVYWLDK